MAKLWLILSAWILLGFSYTTAIIPVSEIVSGGPPKDGIPALNRPRVVPADVAQSWLKPDDRVLGIVVSGQARAYPIRILNWHEIINDKLADKALVVTWCPLCGSGMAFDSSDCFGVSGRLYQSDVLLYDYRTETLWSQLMQKAVAGERAGEALRRYPVLNTSWQQWLRKHPKTTVISRHTGFSRDYNRNPYAGYENTSGLYFDIKHHDARLPTKAWVIGLELDGEYRAWSFEAVKKAGELHEIWQGKTLLIRYVATGEHIEILQDDQRLDGLAMYWFAWATFHPSTELYR